MKRALRRILLPSAVLLSAFVASVAYANNVGDIIGQVLHTDIQVNIEGRPIMGYNFDNQTFVAARDLAAHGFVVGWDEAARRVDIALGASAVAPGNVLQNTQPVSSFAFNVLHTDIVTYVNGTRIDSFNVGGATVVRITDVAQLVGGTYYWNPAQRTVSVQIPQSDEGFVQEVFGLVNNLRVTNGLAPLRWNEDLADIAELHLRDIYENNLNVGNAGSGGETLVQRVARLQPNIALPAGFTVTANHQTPQAMFDWIVSNTARRNTLLNEGADFGGMAMMQHTTAAGNTQPTRINFMVGAQALENNPRVFEQAIFEMINAERAKFGIAPVAWDENIAQTVRQRAQEGRIRGTSGMFHVEQTRALRFNDATPELMFERIAENERLRGFILNPDAVAVGIGYAEVWQLFSAEEYSAVLGIYFITHTGEVANSINPFLVSNMIEAGQLPQSSITLNTGRISTYVERAAWIAEYWANGGASAFEIEVARIVSEERVARGLSPVTFDPTLSMAARYYTQLLIGIGYYTATSPGTAHAQGPHGTSRATANSFGGTNRQGGNAFTPGPQTPRAVVDGWLNSPPHMVFMLNPNHRYVGHGMSLNHAGRPWHYMFMSDAPSN